MGRNFNGNYHSGIQLAISMANSGGAWDNCKKSIKNRGLDMKYSEVTSSEIEVLRVDKERTLLRQIAQIEEDRMNKTAEQKEEVVKEKYIQKSNPFWARAEAASISGDTVGDPLKDTSGPSLNILIKLSSILSVVFSPLFLNTSWLAK